MNAHDMTTEEFAVHFVKVLDARERAAVGLYCECDEPDRLGTMCLECERIDRSVEVEQVLRIVRAHAFEPDDQHPEFCHVCVQLPGHPRHHGVDGVGRLRDGTPVDPASYPQVGTP